MKKISELTPISGEIQGEDILVVNTAGGTRKITYAELCEAVKAALGIREVVESVNITEPGFLMDGKIASEALAQLNGNIEQLNSHYQSLASKVDIKRLQSIPTPVRQEYYIFLCEKELDWLPHWSMGIYISNGFDSVMMWIDVAGGTRIHSAIYNGGSKVWQHD